MFIIKVYPFVDFCVRHSSRVTLTFPWPLPFFILPKINTIWVWCRQFVTQIQKGRRFRLTHSIGFPEGRDRPGHLPRDSLRLWFHCHIRAVKRFTHFHYLPTCWHPPHPRHTSRVMMSHSWRQKVYPLPPSPNLLTPSSLTSHECVSVRLDQLERDITVDHGPGGRTCGRSLSGGSFNVCSHTTKIVLCFLSHDPFSRPPWETVPSCTRTV